MDSLSEIKVFKLTLWGLFGKSRYRKGSHKVLHWYLKKIPKATMLKALYIKIPYLVQGIENNYIVKEFCLINISARNGRIAV